MTSSFETERNSHNAPTVPSHNNVDWSDAVVKWTRDPFIDVMMFPSDDCHESLTQVFKGDFVQVSPRHRSEHWGLCRAGHMMGWVNLHDIKFIVQRRQPRYDARPEPEQPVVHTQPLPQAVAPEPPQEEKSSKRALVSRLIGFFKRI